VPGGIIGVNGGLFLHAQTEAEFASVLAHELAHLSQRHYARGLEAQQRMQLPLMAAMLAGVVAAAAGAGDAAIAAIASGQAAAIQSQRSFSRQNEQEADRIGLSNLRNAGYDPRGMPSMFERLARQYRYDAKPPEFLLTHPLSESRVADSRNRAEQTPTGGKTDSLAYQLMRARTQLQFESTPGLATKRFRAQLEESPQNDAARYGLAISLRRAGQLEEAGSLLQPLLDKSPDDIVYNLARIELDMDAQRYSQATQRLERLLKAHPGNYPLLQMQVELLLAQSRPAEAEAILDRLLRERPKDPDIWYQVAEVRGLAGNIIGVHQARAEFFALVGDYGQALTQLDYAKRRVIGNFPLTARIEARQDELRTEKRLLEEMLR
jgi:predicted Zn-dependent protease